MSIWEAPPKGWTLARLTDAASAPVVYGILQPGPDRKDGVPYVRPTEIQKGVINLADLRRTTEEIASKYRRSSLAPGDIILSIVGTIGKVAVVPLELAGANITQSSARIRVPHQLLLPRFAAYALRSPILVNQFNEARLGTAVPRLNLAHVRELLLPVAPLAEQHRIVEAIESYFTRLDDAVATLERVQRNLKRYRASVLKAAVEGRLVPTEAELARAEGRDYEPASVLLDRILAERRRRWEEAELAKMKAKGRVPKDDKWKANYKEPAAPDSNNLPGLPEGWCWVDLSLIKEFSLYGPRFSSDEYSEEGQLVLRTSDISESGKVNLETAPRIRLSTDEFEKYRASKGDLLITRTGSLGTLAVFNDDIHAIPGAYLIQFRLAGPEQLSWFCFYLFKSPKGQMHLACGGAGVGRPNLNAPTIESLVFGMPPLGEQSRIVTELNRLLSIADGVSSESQRNQKRCIRLRQSILTWAFEGRLVDQDPTDEPASKLLERIRAERESTNPNPRRKPRHPETRSRKA